nr:hypothetical protein Iba_chr11cCG10960 [Ipomoea batatas]
MVWPGEEEGGKAPSPSPPPPNNAARSSACADRKKIAGDVLAIALLLLFVAEGRKDHRRRLSMSGSREYFLLQSPQTIVVHASSPVHEKGRVSHRCFDAHCCATSPEELRGEGTSVAAAREVAGKQGRKGARHLHCRLSPDCHRRRSIVSV